MIQSKIPFENFYHVCVCAKSSRTNTVDCIIISHVNTAELQARGARVERCVLPVIIAFAKFHFIGWQNSSLA